MPKASSAIPSENITGSGKRFMQNRPLTIMNILSYSGRAGADRLALEVCKKLGGRGHRVILACPSHCCLIKEAESSGIVIFPLDYKGKFDMKRLFSFMRFCRDQDVDIVNAHHSHGRYLIVFARLLGFKSKTVFTRHAISGSTPFISSLFYNLTVDMNIAVSDIVRESLLRRGIRTKKAITIYGGIDIDKFENVSQEKIENVKRQYTRPGAFNIGMVGRTDRSKRHEILFKALSGIKKDFNLLILGFSEKDKIERMKQLALSCGMNERDITFCGFQQDIAPFYKVFDLTILPSPGEGLGLSVIESMAAGTPCVGADGGGLREIITDGEDGLMFRPEDHNDLAEKINLLLDDRALREKLIANAKKKVREKFSIETTVRKTEELFYRLVESR